jgi:iron complex outermembrane receptor protein
MLLGGASGVGLSQSTIEPAAAGGVGKTSRRVSAPFKRWLCAGASLVMGVSAVGAAQAQTAVAADAGPVLGEVVVTAQRRAENAQTAPVTVSAFSQSALAARRIDTVVDLKRNVPNLVIEYNNINPSGILAYLRGAGNNGGFINAEQAVGVYIDDIYYARPTGLNLDFPDLDSIEVLRGPQGTLYGRNTLTGAIKFNRREPTGATFGNLEASYGSYNEMRLKGAFSAPINENVAVLLSAAAEKNDGYTHDLVNDRKRGDNTQYAVRGAIAYTGGGPLKASVSLEYTDDHTQGVYFQSFNPTTLQPTVPLHSYGSTVSPFARDSELVADAHVSYEFGPVTLKAITGYIKGVDASEFDLVGGRKLASGAYSFGYDLKQHSTEEQFSQELQASGKAFNGRLDYIGGIYYFHEAPEQTMYVTTNFSATNPPAAPTTYLPQTFALTTNSYAAFAQGVYHVTDRLSATLGLRYTSDRKSLDETLQQSAAVKRLVSVSSSDKFDSMTPKAGLDYRFTSNIFGYATVSKGFQAGGFNASSLANPAAVVRAYAPEKLLAYEVGVKSEFFEHRLRVNVAGYVNKFKDLQLSAVDTVSGALTTQNAGAATVNGLELDTSFTPVRGLVFFANGALSNGKYDSLNPTSSVATAHATRIPYVSRAQGQAGVDYKLPLDALGIAGDKGSLTLGYDISYRTSYTVAASNVPISTMGATSLSNAHIGWLSPDNKLTVDLSAKNLFDRTYYFSGSTAGGLGYRNAGPPRQIRLDVRYNY